MFFGPDREIDRLFRRAYKLLQERRFPEAIELATRARDLALRSYGERHTAYAGSLNNLAVLYRSMGDYAAAEPLYRQALEIRRAAWARTTPNTPTVLNNLAWLVPLDGRYAAAEPLYRQARRSSARRWASATPTTPTA